MSQSSVSKLENRINEVEQTIRNIEKNLAAKSTSEGWCRFGVNYCELKLHPEDPDLVEFFQKLLKRAQATLEPLRQRFDILEELAAETINKKHGE